MYSFQKSRSDSARSQLTPTEFYDFENRPDLAASDEQDAEEGKDGAIGLSLFWRTFFLLALLLIGSILAWLQTLRSLEFEPRIQQTAQDVGKHQAVFRSRRRHAITAGAMPTTNPPTT